DIELDQSLYDGVRQMTATAFITRLEERRRKLGMSMAALAKRSGVSLPTVTRILSGHHSTAHFESIVAISDALGIAVEPKEEKSPHDFLKEVALEKAQRLVKLVQGTSGLEGQAVDSAKINE